MEIIEFNKLNTVLGKFVSELRDVNVQQDMMRFRRNLERIGGIMAYEISRKLEYAYSDIPTPLGLAKANLPDKNVVLGTVLQGGLPLADGIRGIFDSCGNAFVSATRTYSDGEGASVTIDSVSSPLLDGKVLILADSVMATGTTIVSAYEALKKYGTPKAIHIVCALAAQPGIDNLIQKLPVSQTTIWCGAVDPEVNNHGYVVPGLGDAGKHCFNFR
ncbi:MAG: uracil phosphoribosyltransferase [Bacteroidaceae bacterium]|nr:uracil phosphoribosyltransferase [Bacteroidaceae bacterium]